MGANRWRDRLGRVSGSGVRARAKLDRDTPSSGILGDRAEPSSPYIPLPGQQRHHQQGDEHHDHESRGGVFQLEAGSTHDKVWLEQPNSGPVRWVSYDRSYAPPAPRATRFGDPKTRGKSCLSPRIAPVMLDSLELTGRTRGHVREVADPSCTLHPGAAAALIAMRNAARPQGVEIAVASGFRDFGRQLTIWTEKFTGKRPLLDRTGATIARESLDEKALVKAILLWSALPGTSRHHWGSDFDVVDTTALPAAEAAKLVPAEFAAGGRFARLDGWLRANMRRFGFYRPYRTDRGGVQPEPWHLSFAPLAVPALECLTLDTVREALECVELPGRVAVLELLPEIFERYVRAVDAPDAAE